MNNIYRKTISRNHKENFLILLVFAMFAAITVARFNISAQYNAENKKNYTLNKDTTLIQRNKMVSEDEMKQLENHLKKVSDNNIYVTFKTISKIFW